MRNLFRDHHVTLMLAVSVVLGVGVALIYDAVAHGDVTRGHNARPCHAIAHRAGPTATIDDNTLEGMRRTFRHGAIAEVDAVNLLDGRVLFHESRWQQGTDGVGVPEDTTTAYAKTLHTSRNGQAVPTLAQALREAKADGGKLLVELHRWPRWNDAALASTLAAIDRHNLITSVYLTGTGGALKAVHEAAPWALTVWRPDADERVTIGRAERLGLEAVQFPVAYDADVVAKIRAAGFMTWGRQSNSPDWPAAWSRGIFTVQTNRPISYQQECDAFVAANGLPKSTGAVAIPRRGLAGGASCVTRPEYEATYRGELRRHLEARVDTLPLADGSGPRGPKWYPACNGRAWLAVEYWNSPGGGDAWRVYGYRWERAA